MASRSGGIGIDLLDLARKGSEPNYFAMEEEKGSEPNYFVVEV